MKYILFFLLLLYGSVQAQDTLVTPGSKGGWTNVNPGAYGTIQNRMSVGKVFLFPTGCGDADSLWGYDLGQMALYGDSCSGDVWVYNPNGDTWSVLGSGGGGGGGNAALVGSTFLTIIEGGEYTPEGADKVIVLDTTGLLGFLNNYYTNVTVADSASYDFIVYSIDATPNFSYPEGTKVLVASSGTTGIFVDHENNIGTLVGGVYTFEVAESGDQLLLSNDSDPSNPIVRAYRYDGTDWIETAIFVVVGGQKISAPIPIGTNDSNNFVIKTNDTGRVVITTVGDVLANRWAGIEDVPHFVRFGENGKFDTAHFNIPVYDSPVNMDSVMYIVNGRVRYGTASDGGGGGDQNLQEVTDIGNETDNEIITAANTIKLGSKITAELNHEEYVGIETDTLGVLRLYNQGGISMNLTAAPDATDAGAIFMPDNAGRTLAVGATDGETTSYADQNGIINISGLTGGGGGTPTWDATLIQQGSTPLAASRNVNVGGTGNVFRLSTNDYPDGLLVVGDGGGASAVGIGDIAGAANNTFVGIVDAISTINFKADTYTMVTPPASYSTGGYSNLVLNATTGDIETVSGAGTTTLQDAYDADPDASPSIQGDGISPFSISNGGADLYLSTPAAPGFTMTWFNGAGSTGLFSDENSVSMRYYTGFYNSEIAATPSGVRMYFTDGNYINFPEIIPSEGQMLAATLISDDDYQLEWVDPLSGGGSDQDFAVTGEDDIATANRLFDQDNHSFTFRDGAFAIDQSAGSGYYFTQPLGYGHTQAMNFNQNTGKMTIQMWNGDDGGGIGRALLGETYIFSDSENVQPPKISLRLNGTNRFQVFNDGSAKLNAYTSGAFYQNDTASYKPIVADASGNLYRSSWFGGSGEGGGGSAFLPTSGTGTATGNITGALGTNILTISNSSDALFKIDPTVDAENVILRASSGSSTKAGNINMGWQDNLIEGGYNNAILWGGTSVYPNQILGTNYYQTVIGAYDNIIDSAIASTIVGGAHHRINDIANHGFIGGGSFDTIYKGNYPVIVGGTDNSSHGNNTAIVGGAANRITADAHYSSIYGSNQGIIDASTYASITGSLTASISGGSTGSGIYNGTNGTITSSMYSSILGARNAVISTSDYSVIVGGRYDSVDANYAFASGYQSRAGGDYSIAMGRQAKSLNQGTATFGDATAADLNNTTDNSWLSRYSGGYTFNGGAITTQGGITKRVTSITSSSTPSPSAATDDGFKITALGVGATFASPGTGTAMQELIIRIKDDGTARALNWNAIYRASSDLPLPTVTTLGKTMYLKFIYNADDSKWDLVAFLNNF